MQARIPADHTKGKNKSERGYDQACKKAIKGSKAAYGELIAQYQVYLYKTAFLYVKNEADSLDAVQECVTRGLLGIEKLKEPKYFKTWITRILLNCIWQDQKRTQTVSLDEYREKAWRII